MVATARPSGLTAPWAASSTSRRGAPPATAWTLHSRRAPGFLCADQKVRAIRKPACCIQRARRGQRRCRSRPRPRCGTLRDRSLRVARLAADPQPKHHRRAQFKREPRHGDQCRHHRARRAEVVLRFAVGSPRRHDLACRGDLPKDDRQNWRGLLVKPKTPLSDTPPATDPRGPPMTK